MDFNKVFHSIKIIEYEGDMDKVFETDRAFAVIKETTDESLFNYVAAKNVESEKGLIKDFLTADKFLKQHSKEPKLLVPYYDNSQTIVNNLVAKDFLSVDYFENVLLFTDNSFLEKEFDIDKNIKFEVANNPQKYALAVYDNFNSLVTEDDLYGGLEEEYIPGIIQAFNNTPEVTHLHFQAVDNDKIISTMSIAIDNKNKIAGLANASTHGDYRGKRISSKLIQIAIDEVKKLGAEEVFFYTEAGNSSEKAYLKSGFEIKFKLAMLHPNYEKINKHFATNNKSASNTSEMER